MEAEQLFYNLLRAEDETKVDTILSDQGYLDDDSMWLPLGGVENNFSTVGNQQAEPTGALVDKLINGIDAVLMAECFSTGVSPESAEAPQSMREAVERFLGVRDGRLMGSTRGNEPAWPRNPNSVSSLSGAKSPHLISL